MLSTGYLNGVTGKTHVQKFIGAELGADSGCITAPPSSRPVFFKKEV